MKTIVSERESIADYGRIVFTLKKYLDDRNISQNSVATKAGISFKVVTRYYNEGEDIARIDTDVLAKLCYVLECSPQDLIEHRIPPGD